MNTTSHSGQSSSYFAGAIPTAEQLRQLLGAHGSNARCPAHEDETASLSIGDRDGKVVFKCHAGCDQQRVITALQDRGIWPKAEGLTVAELARAKHLSEALLRESGFADDEVRGLPVVRMQYRDQTGRTICTRYRGSGHSFWFRKGDRQRLFGLWRLRPEPVILVEGETDAIALWAAGFNAIGVPGAEAWNEDRFAASLQQCPEIFVHVEPDSGGEKFSAKFERSCLCSRIKFFQCAPAAKDPCELRAKDPFGFRASIEELLKSASAVSPRAGAHAHTDSNPNTAGPSKSQPAREPWGVPVDLWAPMMPLPELPTGLLPHTLDAFARALPHVFSPAALGSAALAACSIATSANIRLQINALWSEPFIIWVALCGASSSAKSPTIKQALRPVQSAQARKFEEYEEALERWEQTKKTAKKAGESCDEPPPACVRYTSQNATIEALSEILKRNDHGLGFTHDELSALLAAMDGAAYREKGGASGRGDWLALYDCGSHNVDRILRGEVRVRNFAATVLGGVTIDKISRTIRESAADGLLPRFCFVQLPQLPPTDDLSAIAPQIYEQYHALVLRLLNNRPAKPVAVQMSEDACTILGAAQKKWQTEAQLHAERLPRYAERLGKLVGLAARIALGFAIIEEAETPGFDGPAFRECNPPRIVTQDQMHRACAYLDYQSRHDFSLYWHASGEAGDLPHVQAAKIAASFVLQQGDLSRFQLGELTRGAREWRHLKPPDQYAALSLLEQFEWLKPSTPCPFVGGQFVRGTVWEVNPAVHEIYRERAEALRRLAAEVKQRICDAQASK